jgi:hypothetical protein
VGFNVHGAGVVDDYAGLGFFLWRLGAEEECFINFDAVFHYFMRDQPAMDLVWLFTGIWA